MNRLELGCVIKKGILSFHENKALSLYFSQRKYFSFHTDRKNKSAIFKECFFKTYTRRCFGTLYHCSSFHSMKTILTLTPFNIFSFDCVLRNQFATVGNKKINTYFYKVLEIDPEASQKEIKSAYYRMSKLHHPDTSTKSESHKRIIEINEAYEVLGNESKRQIYDQSFSINANKEVNKHYSSWYTYDYTQNMDNFSSHWQDEYFYDFDNEKRQQYNAKRKNRKCNTHQCKNSKNFKSKNYNPNKSNFSWDNWYHEQRYEYAHLKRNKNKHKNKKSCDWKHQQSSVKNNYGGQSRRPQDEDPDSQRQYYDHVYQKHKNIKDQMNNLFKGEKKKTSSKRREAFNSISKNRFSVEEFFQCYDEYIKNRQQRTKYINETEIPYFDEDFFDFLEKYNEVLKAIDKEPKSRNQREFLRVFLRNFY